MARVFVLAFACATFTTYFTSLLFTKYRDQDIYEIYKVP